MANTYSQIYLHYVFAVQNRMSLINKDWQEDLYKYMSGIAINQKHKVFAINGMPDHIHMLISMNPTQSPSDLMHDIKRSSSLWINKNRFVKGNFSWQEGYGVFSYGKSQVKSICEYIENQKAHHGKRTFQEEYLAFLKLFEVEYDEKYIFKPIE